MSFAVKCLLGLAVFAAPCAYDADPREPSVFAALISPVSPPAVASLHVPDTLPVRVP